MALNLKELEGIFKRYAVTSFVPTIFGPNPFWEAYKKMFPEVTPTGERFKQYVAGLINGEAKEKEE